MADQVYLGTIFTNNDPDTGGLKSGDVVQLDSTLDNAVIKVVGANSPSVIGVVIVGASKGSQVTICGFTGQRIRLNIDGAASVNRGDQLVSDGTIAGTCKVDNAATADEVFAVAIAAKTTGVGSQVEALYLAPAVSNATGTGANANAYYLVARSTNAPTNAINLGALTTGFLKATIVSGVATITTDSTGGAPETSKYIIQQPDAALPNAQALSALPTGLVKNTTTTGVLSTAIINTDYPSVLATYIVASSVGAPPNSVNLGVLTSGLLKQTVTAGVAAIAIAIPGTDYLTSASLAYQTISNAGTVLPQHLVLNFDGTVVATNSTSPAQTNVGLPIMSGLTPGSYFLANIIVDPYGRVIAATSTTSITSLAIVADPGGIAFFNPSGALLDDPIHANWNANTNTATFTNVAVSTLASSLVKSNGSGLLQNAIDGTDYISPATAFYQTLVVNGSVQTQRKQLGFSSNFVNADTSSPSRSTIDLSPTGVTPGSYTNTSITVDSFGRITLASTGAGGGGGSVASVSGTAGNISSTGGTTPIINLIATAVTAGSYTYGNFTVDAFGRVTAASSGTAPVTSIVGTSPIFATGTSVVTISFQGGYVSGGTSTTPQNLGGLSSGLLKGTVIGGINTISTATAGTDYQVAGNYISALTGDVVATGPGSVSATIAVNAVSNAKFRQSVGLSVIANPTGSTANVQDLTATGTGQVLWDNAGTLVFSLLPYSVISGAPTSLPPSGAAGGGLGGTYPNPTVTLANKAIGFGSTSNTLTGDVSNLSWDDTNFRMGVRTSNPAFEIHAVDEVGSSDRGVTVGTHITSTVGSAITLRKSRGSFASPSTITNADYLGVIGFEAHDGTNYVRVAQTGVHALGGGTISTGSVPSIWYLNVNAAGSTDPYSLTNPVAIQAFSTNNQTSFNLAAGSTPLVSTTVSASPAVTITPNLFNNGTSTNGHGLFIGTGNVGGNSGTAAGFLFSQNTLTSTNKGTFNFSILGPSISSTAYPSFNLNVGTGFDLTGITRLAMGIANTSFDWFNRVVSTKFSIKPSLGFPITDDPSWTEFKFVGQTTGGFDQAITSIPFDAISFQTLTPFTAIGNFTNSQAVGFNYFSIYAPALSALVGVNLALTYSATLAISGVPTGSSAGGLTPATIANAYGLWVQGANTTISARFDGGIIINGQASTAVQISAFTAGYVKSNSTGFLSVSATIPAADVTGLFYQTVSEAGSALAQQPILNFDGTVVATNGTGKTNVGLPLQGGLTAGSYTNTNLIVDAYGRITAVSNGSSGGGGVVTSATAPLFISGSNIAIQGSIVSGSTSTSAQNLGTLASGVLKQTVTSGVATLSIAAPGVDYVSTVSGTTPIVNVGTVANPDFALQGGLVSGSTSSTAQNLGSLSAGLLKQSVSSGIATIATAVAGTDYQSAITWPAINQVLVSSGTSTAPVGDSHFTVDPSTHIVTSAAGTVLGGSVNFTGGAGVGEVLMGLANTGFYELVFPFNGISLSSGALSGVPFVASGGSHSIGMVPDPGGTAGTTRFLREDATWASAASGAAYKFSINFFASFGMLANTATVVIPGDSGTIATGAGVYSGSGGTSVPAIVASVMGAPSSPTMYTTTRAYSSVKWTILQQVANVTVASGANVRYSLYMTTDPFNSVAYTLLATFDTGAITIGTGNYNAFFNTVSGLSIPADTIFFISAHRTDVASTSVLSPLQFTSTVEFIV